MTLSRARSRVKVSQRADDPCVCEQDVQSSDGELGDLIEVDAALLVQSIGLFHTETEKTEIIGECFVAFIFRQTFENRQFLPLRSWRREPAVTLVCVAMSPTKGSPAPLLGGATAVKSCFRG